MILLTSITVLFGSWLLVDVDLCAVCMLVFCGCVVVESEFLQVRLEFGAWSMFLFSNCARFLLRSHRDAFPLRDAVSIAIIGTANELRNSQPGMRILHFTLYIKFTL